jgi:hypothetical protein
MAVDYDTLINLTTTSGSADIGAPLSGHASSADRLALLADVWRLLRGRLGHIASVAEWLPSDRTDPFPDVEQPV